VLGIGAGTVVHHGIRFFCQNSFISSARLPATAEQGIVNKRFNGVTTTLTATPDSGPPATNFSGVLPSKLVNLNLVVRGNLRCLLLIESATNLGRPVVWKTVTNSLITTNGTNQVVLICLVSNRFFGGFWVDASTINQQVVDGYQGGIRPRVMARR